jgi:hypothetical protein
VLLAARPALLSTPRALLSTPPALLEGAASAPRAGPALLAA